MPRRSPTPQKQPRRREAGRRGGPRYEALWVTGWMRGRSGADEVIITDQVRITQGLQTVPLPTLFLHCRNHLAKTPAGPTGDRHPAARRGSRAPMTERAAPAKRAS